MKNLARLIIFFSLAFVILFICSGFFRFLSAWIDSVSTISAETEQGGILLASFSWALPVTLFLTILLALSFSVRKKISAVPGIITVFLLSVIFCLGFYYGMERMSSYDPSFRFDAGLSRSRGLILSQLDTDMVILGDTGFPRVVSFPERPLLYQETGSGPASAIVSLPMESKVPWFVQSILIDFSLTSAELNNRFSRGIISFLAYAGSLLLLLSCMRFLFEISAWPMANFFLGALVFRLVLSLGVFLNTDEVKHFLVSFVNNRIPDYLVIPLAFLIISVIVIPYTIMAFFIRQGRRYDD